MRTSIIAILLALGVGGCVVREPAYVSTGVYASAGYPVYYGDGYYWAYSDAGWYWWSHDHWVLAHHAPRHYVVVNGHHGHRGWGHGDHRGDYRGDRGTHVRDHRTQMPPRTSAPPRSAAPPPRMHRGGTRDHRRGR
jgi:hypothetical protein